MTTGAHVLRFTYTFHVTRRRLSCPYYLPRLRRRLRKKHEIAPAKRVELLPLAIIWVRLIDMHEYAVTQELIHLITQECERSRIVKPTKVILQVGSLSSYQAEPIRFYFDLLKAESPPLSSAELEIEEVQARFRCASCQVEREAEDLWMLACPTCPGARTEITCGNDLLLKTIVGETNDDCRH